MEISILNGCRFKYGNDAMALSKNEAKLEFLEMHSFDKLEPP